VRDLDVPKLLTSLLSVCVEHKPLRREWDQELQEVKLQKLQLRTQTNIQMLKRDSNWKTILNTVMTNMPTYTAV